MQIGELRLERDNGMAVAGDVAGPSGANAHPACGLDHGIDDSGVSSHPEIVVRALYDDFAGGAGAAPACIGRADGVPLEIGEDAIAALPTDTIEERMKITTQRHHVLPRYRQECRKIRCSAPLA